MKKGDQVKIRPFSNDWTREEMRQYADLIHTHKVSFNNVYTVQGLYNQDQVLLSLPGYVFISQNLLIKLN